MAWYPGREGGTAIAEVLFGDVEPSGKLPVTFPQAESDLPPFDNTSHAVTYDYYHGYRYLDHNGHRAAVPVRLRPLVHHASITRISPSHRRTLAPYGRVRVTRRRAPTPARWRATRSRSSTSSYEGSAVERAVSGSEGLRARATGARAKPRPSSSTCVRRTWRYWNVAAGGWELEPITYVIRVGRSSHDFPLMGTVVVNP